MIPITMQANHLGSDPSADLIRLDTLQQRIAKAIISIWFCLQKALWPTKLSPHYVIHGPDADFSELLVACTTLLVFLFIGLASCFGAKDRGSILAVWIHIIAFFLPVSGLIQHGMIQKGGDRYAYVPLAAFAPALAALLFYGVRARPKNHKIFNFILITASIMILTSEAQLTARQVVIWRSDLALLRHAIAIDPFDWRCLDTLGEFLLRNGYQTEATQLLERALQTVELMPLPFSPKLAVFRGKNLVLTGRVDEGCALFHQAKELYPESPLPHNNAAICDLRHQQLVPLQRKNFEIALSLAYREDQITGAAANLRAYDIWQANGYQGTFDGTLLY
eukprot:CAMPEP_0197323922 /NCGR_PEP_ID=MMETSP0891-20130614/70808_1 /TAXON_ID=44058 ORGANISM="Aureoumbra lagunensis, Strain CCMP1510" /NCGR_SAMPLE_ID=MMETSP0891 /ASSEMBLY_ACC=CAM_ASM_000534 /LENGTH=334 /DNA_ID=CAMNT_0042816655 /DNA_START=651 /DNA_END=1655 /DNA_ORIENTATION=+